MIQINNYKIFIKRKKCSYCENTTVIKRAYSGEFLCQDCFKKSIEKIISKTISKYRMIKPKDKIIVALSGGKDSISLLYNLFKIQERTYFSEPLTALSIDEGITNYRINSIKISSEFCKKYNIEHVIISFKDVIGKTLDEIINIKKSNNNYQYACNYCATIRRRLLNDYAKELGGDILAIGHNLTDIAETYLMNIFFKRYHLIANQYIFKREATGMEHYFIKKVMPLMRIPEEEIFLYVNFKKLSYYPSHCPYRESDPIVRKKVLEFIQEIKQTSPEIEFNLLNGFLELSEILYKNYKKKEYNLCQNCGYPSSNQDYCVYCNLKKELNS